jgi:hypothetical protein
MRRLERIARTAIKNRADIVKVYDAISDALPEDKVNNQLGYPPNSYPSEDYYFYLCGCDDIEYCPQNMVHFTEVWCRKAKIAYCVYADDQGNIHLRKHPKGACPDGQYKRSRS